MSGHAEFKKLKFNKADKNLNLLITNFINFSGYFINFSGINKNNIS